MKRFLPIVFTVLSFVIISCDGGKSGDPVPVATTTSTGNNNSGGTTTGGSTGTTGGTTSTPYVVKTLGISNMAVFTSVTDGIMTSSIEQFTDGSGTVVDMRTTGNDITIEAINIDGAVITPLNSTYSTVAFPKYAATKSIASVTAADSVIVTTFKLKGFKNVAYNQLNLILVDNKSVGAGTVDFKTAKSADLTPANISSALSGKKAVYGKLSLN